jgi:hypothetical protein
MYQVGDGECPFVIVVNLISYNLTDNTDKSGGVINTDDFLQRARRLSIELLRKLRRLSGTLSLLMF